MALIRPAPLLVPKPGAVAAGKANRRSAMKTSVMEVRDDAATAMPAGSVPADGEQKDKAAPGKS